MTEILIAMIFYFLPAYGVWSMLKSAYSKNGFMHDKSPKLEDVFSVFVPVINIPLFFILFAMDYETKNKEKKEWIQKFFKVERK